MRKIIVGLVSVAALGAAGLAVLAAIPIGTPPKVSSLTGDVDRGAYLARASGCIACHTNFEEGGAPLAGGVELETPFGTLYSPNLTIDPVHGIGDMTTANEIAALNVDRSNHGLALGLYPTRPMAGTLIVFVDGEEVARQAVDARPDLPHRHVIVEDELPAGSLSVRFEDAAGHLMLVYDEN